MTRLDLSVPVTVSVPVASACTSHVETVIPCIVFDSGVAAVSGVCVSTMVDKGVATVLEGCVL